MNSTKKTLFHIILAANFVLLIAAIIIPFMAHAQFNQARKLEADYRWKKAGEKYLMAVRLGPFNSEYFAEAGNFLIRQSTYRKDNKPWLERAEKLYKRALKLNPRCAEYALRLGEIMAGRDEPQEAFEYFREALANDPNGFNTSYSIGYAGIKIWNLLGTEQKAFVLNRLKYALKSKPSYDRYIYPKLWQETKDFKILKQITPETYVANKNLYYFIQQHNLWQFRKEQLDALRYYAQKERVEELEKEEGKKDRLLRTLRALAMAGKLDSWTGESQDGKSTYENGNMFWAGTVNRAVDAPRGRAVIKIKAKGSPAYGIWPYMVVALDGEEIGEMFADSSEWKEYAFKVNTEGGLKILSVTFVNDEGDMKKGTDRNLYVGEAQVVGSR